MRAATLGREPKPCLSERCKIRMALERAKHDGNRTPKRYPASGAVRRGAATLPKLAVDPSSDINSLDLQDPRHTVPPRQRGR